MTSYTSPEFLTEPNPEFEELYIRVRDKEHRVLTDAQVKQLPEVDSNNPHYREWKKRDYTSLKFIAYLKGHSRNKILDVGCGNGWFTHRISEYCSAATGLDVNRVELEQAARLFGNAKTKFVYADIFTASLTPSSHDIIVFNASVQYFANPEALIARCKELLTEKGELHFLDSPFYDREEITPAKERTAAYYKALGFPEAANYYHHHSKETVRSLGSEILYSKSLLKKLFVKYSPPFPWIRICK